MLRMLLILSAPLHRSCWSIPRRRTHPFPLRDARRQARQRDRLQRFAAPRGFVHLPGLERARAAVEVAPEPVYRPCTKRSGSHGRHWGASASRSLWVATKHRTQNVERRTVTKHSIASNAHPFYVLYSTLYVSLCRCQSRRPGAAAPRQAAACSPRRRAGAAGVRERVLERQAAPRRGTGWRPRRPGERCSR